MSQGKAFRHALQAESPLQIAGAINTFSALLAQRAGFLALYLSGAGVANASLGLPDLGITSRNDVLEDARRITGQVSLPLLVDIDTGWGDYLNIARTIREMIHANVAAVHIEDQMHAKRCGHRPKKQLTDTADMVDRLHAAIDAKTDADFVIMARTDALASEGLNAAIDRVMAYVNAGADMIFFEGATCLEDYAAVTAICPVPVLANITEFGVTPLFSTEQLKSVNIRLALYPLSAFRAMNLAAEKTYHTIRQEGSQKKVVSHMQTREQLYDILQYEVYEKIMDKWLQKEKNHE